VANIFPCLLIYAYNDALVYIFILYVYLYLLFQVKQFNSKQFDAPVSYKLQIIIMALFGF